MVAMLSDSVVHKHNVDLIAHHMTHFSIMYKRWGSSPVKYDEPTRSSRGESRFGEATRSLKSSPLKKSKLRSETVQLA